jgi:hypothetical protein
MYCCRAGGEVERQKMTHLVTSPPSIDALQNDQSLQATFA